MRERGTLRAASTLLVPVVAWAVCWALVMSTMRIWVLAVFGVGTSEPSVLLLSFLRIPAHIVEGMLLGAALVHAHSRRWIPATLVALAVLGNLVALHYEATFGELPSFSAIEYLGQFGQVMPGVQRQAPLPIFVLELVLTSAVFVLPWWLLTRESAWQSRRPVRIAAAAVAVASILTTTTILAFPGVVGPRARWSMRSPLPWFLVSANRPGDDGGSDPSPGDRYQRLQVFHGHERPFASSGAGHPLCAADERSVRRSPTGRSVIVVLLEGAGREEMRLRPGGELLMPALEAASRRGYSNHNFVANGTMSCQALPGIVSGQPPQPWGIELWRHPLARFEGLPSVLREAGYRSVYLHGGDLAFEQQRSFLRMNGFDELVEFDPEDPTPVHGWGWSDGEMFERTREWVDHHHARRGDAPFFALLATLTSHNPYEIPDTWQRRFDEERRGEFVQSFGAAKRRWDFLESLAYLDHELGLFIEWYERFERPRGTYLVVVADHAPLQDNGQALAEGRPLRFDVPLVILGPDDEVARWKLLEHRHGSQMDLPATVSGLVGLPPPPCDQGVDLLGPFWPRHRIVPAVGGRDLNEVYLWSPHGHVRMERRENRMTILGLSGTAHSAGALRATMRDYLKLFLPISRLLFDRRSYAPGGPPVTPKPGRRFHLPLPLEKLPGKH